MAGMFFSLQQVAQKLNKTEDEIQELVKAGKLREFRDGDNVLFKIEEVESLMSETAILPAEQIDLEPAEPEPKPQEDRLEPELEELKLEEVVQEPKAEEGKIDEKSFETKKAEPEAEEENISLAEDTSEKEDLISSDTAIIGEDTGLDVKGTDVENLEDLMLDTGEGKTGAPLAEGEEDLSLDTFGSGGLLDVSLQADDTSLGGILDEIYTSEGEPETPVAATAPEMEAAADEMLAEEAQSTMEAVAIMPMAVEAPPDTMSNAFGIMLIVPLLVVFCTVVVAILGSGDNVPAALQSLLKNGPYGIHIIWYVMLVAAVIEGLIVGGAAMMSGSAAKPKKKPKVKAPKAPKKPKPKKPKKEKKPKK